MKLFPAKAHDHSKKESNWAESMVQGGKVLTVKDDRTHMREGENQFPQNVLWSPHTCPLKYRVNKQMECLKKKDWERKIKLRFLPPTWYYSIIYLLSQSTYLFFPNALGIWPASLWVLRRQILCLFSIMFLNLE